MSTQYRLKLKVTATMESQSQSSTTTPDQWTEIIEDLWDLLPHFQQWYDEDCLKFDCVKLQFGDGEEISNDDEMWLDQNCENESPTAIEENKQVSESKHNRFLINCCHARADIYICMYKNMIYKFCLHVIISDATT